MRGSREHTIRAIYACINEDRLDALDALIAPTAALMQDPAFPDSRTWHGPDGVRRWFSQITAEFGTLGIELTDASAEGDHVLATVEISVSGRTSGAPIRHRMAHLWSFRDGVVECCRFYLDVEQGHADFDQRRTAPADA